MVYRPHLMVYHVVNSPQHLSQLLIVWHTIYSSLGNSMVSLPVTAQIPLDIDMGLVTARISLAIALHFLRMSNQYSVNAISRSYIGQQIDN
jgi:hypothetical protein